MSTAVTAEPAREASISARVEALNWIEVGSHLDGHGWAMVEQPRMQSRAEVVPLRQGDGAIFAVHHRPVQGARGVYRVNLRHGVSRLRSGRRHTVGVIFHDAT